MQDVFRYLCEEKKTIKVQIRLSLALVKHQLIAIAVEIYRSSPNSVRQLN